jgi:uncharacterized glyoxalase superfamily protein PhnB
MSKKDPAFRTSFARKSSSNSTDSIPEMGFSVIPCSYIQINFEPESREEAHLNFDALSDGGKIEMPLQDTFWDAYFGSFTDKFGSLDGEFSKQIIEIK